MVVRMRATRAHRNNRRSHHWLKEKGLSKCPDCGASIISHIACSNCGKYKGRLVINVQARLDKKAKKLKEREKQASK
jgi:large subunit ribosomal protein L32